ncbi:hypothetical protein NC653_039937 [Populus alba x Populus x berolinensis]|uniref:Uncharacterized protein n=2 Tax=Populus TaxID=3689 RepID=A0A4V6A749_POPAL|nr:hypothetical protein NC653_039937 [Populus alba x Populus x berolinensis]TKR97315.1 hypothetical protein D5086_0000215380 [Populus alba]
MTWPGALLSGSDTHLLRASSSRFLLSSHPGDGRALHVCLCLTRGQTCNTHMLNALVYTNSLAMGNSPNHYCVGYANPDASYPPPVEGGGSNVDGYGRTLVHMGVGSAGGLDNSIHQ